MAEKKQRSLFWIITTIYLTMGLSGSILATIFVLIGAMIVSGAPYALGLLILLLLRLAGFLLGLRIGVNYVCDRSFVKQEDIFKISLIVATIPIVFLILFGWGRGFEVIDAVLIIEVLTIFYASKWFLTKRVSAQV